MFRRASLYSASPLVVALALSFAASASAQPAAPPVPAVTGPVEKVVVTGSHIKRTRESTALPVDVVTAEDLEKEGAPTIVEVAKGLSVSNGVIGDTNQFDARAQGSEGTASINLRGLGPQRTLILLNGRRLALNPFGLAGQGIVDTNVLPVAALDRIEVLKDGAAVTYGSDAIGGVVNFITKRNYDGAYGAGDWRVISGADGDYSLRGAYGFNTEKMDVFLSVGYQHRSELDTLERNFTQSQYLQNPEGGYSAAGNPGTFLSSIGTIFRDPQCAALGGTPGFSGTTQVCQSQYIDYDNLQEEENKLQVFGSVGIDLSAHDRFFVDVLVATTDVPHWETTPSYAILSTPSIEAQQVPAVPAFMANRFFVPPTNPGLANFVLQNPTFAGALAGGAAVLAPAARPLFLGGNPLFGNGGQNAYRYYEAERVSGGFEGDITEHLAYQLDLTYSRQRSSRNGWDTLTDRYALALRGFGGPNCDTQPNTPGIQGPGGGAPVAGANGCQWFNPFSNAIQRNAIDGQVNPQFNATFANDPAVIDWFFKELSTDQEADLFVADGIITGDTGFHFWADDSIEYAFGAQYRRDSFQADYNDLANSLVSPCVASVDFFNNVCTGAARNGPFVFLGVATPVDLNGSVYALYTEWSLPITNKFNIQAAARFEDYGGDVGSTFDPKVSARWQVAPWLALRGSAGSTFRGPPLVQLAPNNITSLQSVLGTFRAIDIGGNPLLTPESADTFSVGAILDFKWFRGSIDYWGFDFSNPIIGEPIGGIIAAVFPNGPAPAANNCANPAFAALVARFTFTGGVCSSANVARVQTFYVNGSPVVTKGVDFLGEVKFGEMMGGDIGAGGTLTYVDTYHVDPISVAGIPVQPGFEAAGFLNYQTTAYPIPQWKGSAYLDYTSDQHFLRLTMNYIDSYIDQRTSPFLAGAYRDPLNNPVTVSRGKVIDEFITFDLTYRWTLRDDMALALAIDNIFDEDPPFARLDLSYDPLTATTLGRTFKFGIRKEF